MADPRDPSGGRPPILPLPPPLDTDEPAPPGTAHPPRARRRSPDRGGAHELPRLPEVATTKGPAEVDVDPRALSPVRASLSGALRFTLHHVDIVYQAVYNTDGSRLITACGDGTVRIWDASNGILVRELRRERSHVTTLSRCRPTTNLLPQ